VNRDGSQFGNWVATIAATCALVVTIAVVRRELFSEAPSFMPRSVRDYSPVPVEDWDILRTGGQRIGSEDPVLTIVEFADYQCPACRRFHLEALSPLLKQFSDDVLLIFRHWPLPYHPHAYAAARSAECAAAQGRFGPMTDILYQRQDSIGVSALRTFAEAAGVPDLTAFDACTAARDSLDTVNRDMELALRLGGTGTPTLIMNGQFLRYVPDSAGLVAILEQARKGEL
jgi:protein-disulfide isomerase